MSASAILPEKVFTKPTQGHIGKYSGVDHIVASTKEIPTKLQFFIATTKEVDSTTGEILLFHSLIPDNWVSLDKTHFLYPPPNSHAPSNGPTNWTHAIFRRNYYPRSLWDEHVVENFLFKHPIEHCHASAARKKLLAGILPENITDCEAPLDKKTRRLKRKKQLNSSESDTEGTSKALGSHSTRTNLPSDVLNDEIDDMLFPFGTDNPSLASIANITELVNNYLDDSAIVIDEHNQNLSGCSHVFAEVQTKQVVEPQHTIYACMEENDGNSTTEQTSNDFVNLVQKRQMIQARMAVSCDEMVYAMQQHGTSKDCMEHNDDDLAIEEMRDDRLNAVQERQMVKAHIEDKDDNSVVDQEAREETFLIPSPKRRRLFSFDAQQNNAETFGGTIVEPHNELRRSTPDCPAGLCHREHECCYWVQKSSKQIAQIYDELLLLKEIVMENSKENQTKKIPFRQHNQDSLKYHEMITNDNFSNVLPCDSVAKLVALDTLLSDVNLAVSLVIKLTNEFKSVNTINKFVNAIYSRMVSKATSEQLQWKSHERGGDRRQGLSHLVNFVSVIGAAVKAYCKHTNNNLKEFMAPTVVELIKAARKLEAELYRKKEKLSPDVAKEMAKTAVPQSVPVKMSDQDILLAIESAISRLELAISNFKIPSLVLPIED